MKRLVRIKRRNLQGNVIVLSLDSRSEAGMTMGKDSMTGKGDVVLVGKHCISTPVILDLIEDPGY